MKHSLIVILFLISINGFSQNTEKESQIKVGLVLSGGGAKGFAHIGALKVIDSLGIKVDYIAGTSMGAIVGSLYASGYTGKQLDSIFKKLDFNDVINDKTPRRSKSFYEKNNSERYAVTLPFDDFKINLPSAISKGQNVYNLLTRLTMHVSDIDDFSKLPIPFFCIATDIETGEQVILDHGNLAQAVKASGAFPSLFQPVVIDNKVLIDGGVANNYPIKELKAKGLDVIIGVDVQDDLADRLDLKSADKILVQINNYRTIKDMKIKSKLTDIYIKPNIKDFTVVSFSQGERIIKNGEEAALSQLQLLNDLASKKYNAPREPIAIINVDSLNINSVKIIGNRDYTRAYIIGKLKVKNNEKISYEKFIQGINNLVSTHNFDNVTYAFHDNYGMQDVVIKVIESASKAFIKLGLHYDDLYKSAALVNVTKKKLFTKNDVASLDFILGDHIRYNFEYFIDKGFYWSIGLSSRYNAFNKNISASLLLSETDVQNFNLNKIDAGLSDFTNQFYLQTLFRKDFTLRLGAEHKRLKIESETILDNINEEETTFENSEFLGVFGNLKLDTYDNKYFPTKGFYFNGDFNLYLYSSDFNNNFSEFSIAKADVGIAFKLADKLAATIGSNGGFKIGDNSVNSLNFGLGGNRHNFINNFFSFYGYDFFSLTGNSFVKGSINLDYNIFHQHHISLTANYANIEDGIFETGEWFSNPDYSGYALGYGIETFLGPIEAKYTWSPDTKKSFWFFNLGFWF